MKTNEYIELKQLLLEVASMTKIIYDFLPEKVSISFLVEKTGKRRQSLREYIINNFMPETDFWEENGKIFVSRRVAIAVISRSSK